MTPQFRDFIAARAPGSEQARYQWKYGDGVNGNANGTNVEDDRCESMEVFV